MIFPRKCCKNESHNVIKTSVDYVFVLSSSKLETLKTTKYIMILMFDYFESN